MTKILVDENIPISVMQWLRKRGINIQRTSEVNLKGARDEDIAK